MRLLFLTNVLPSPLHPARGVFNLGLLRALAQKGHSVSAIVPIPWTDWFRASPARRRELGQATELFARAPVRYPVYFYTPGALRIAYGHFMWHGVRKASLNMIARQRPEAVIGYWTHPDGHCAIQAARIAGIPSLVMVGGSDVLLLTSKPSRRRAIYRVLNESDAVITVSEDLRQKIVANGVDKQKVHLIRRGIDTDRFHPGDRLGARQSLALPMERPILLWVGRMETVKGLPVLLDAIQQLQKDGIDVQTVLVGAGAETSATSAAIQRRGLSRRVSMPGAVPHEKLADYYRAADLTVLPSFSEGVPNVLLESIACGTPFVASRVGGIPEIATPGIDQLVPPGDHVKLANAIRDVLVSTKSNNLRVFKPEDWPTAASRLIDVIELVLDRKPKQQIENANPCTIP